MSTGPNRTYIGISDQPNRLITETELTNHTNNKNNPHEVKSTQVSIGDALASDMNLSDGTNNVENALNYLNVSNMNLNNMIMGGNDNLTYWTKFHDDVSIQYDQDITQSPNRTVYSSYYWDKTQMKFVLTGESYTFSDTSPAWHTRAGWYTMNDYFGLLELTESSSQHPDAGGHMRYVNFNRISHILVSDGYVTNENPSTYPDDGYASDGYWYKKQQGITINLCKIYTGILPTATNGYYHIVCTFEPRVIFIGSTGFEYKSSVYDERYYTYRAIWFKGLNYDNINRVPDSIYCIYNLTYNSDTKDLAFMTTLQFNADIVDPIQVTILG